MVTHNPTRRSFLAGLTGAALGHARIASPGQARRGPTLALPQAEIGSQETWPEGWAQVRADAPPGHPGAGGRRARRAAAGGLPGVVAHDRVEDQ